jgi:NodT family efflux transporter outer membrane factor (OMF) lipoprotein
MKRYLSRYAAAGLLLALQGCTTLGPDYAVPEIDWVEVWESDLYGRASSVDAQIPVQQDLTFWWEAFNDPVLNQLIETAREENPGLRLAGLAIAQSRALLGIAAGSRYPQLQQANGAVARVDSWPTEGDNSGDRSDLTSYNLGFDIGWELDFWGRFARGIESADAAFFASITNQQDAQILLSAQVAQAYFTYRTTAQQIEIARMNADLQKRSLDITQRLYDSGQDSELDLQQAKTQYLSTIASIPALEASLQQIGNALSVLLARPPGELPELTANAPPLPRLDPVMIQEMPARLMMRRPDIRTAAWQVASQSAQIGVAEAELYPAISLFGTIGWSGSSLDGSVDTLTTGIGPSFSWNLFNYGRLENNVRFQDALLQQSIVRYESTVLQAAREIDDAAISVVKTREQDAMLADALASSERALKLATTRYREGYSDFQRVLDAQRSLALQSTNYVANQGAHLNAVIDFYKALGGGWQPATAEDFIPADTRQAMQQRTDWGELLDQPLPQPPR